MILSFVNDARFYEDECLYWYSCYFWSINKTYLFPCVPNNFFVTVIWRLNNQYSTIKWTQSINQELIKSCRLMQSSSNFSLNNISTYLLHMRCIAPSRQSTIYDMQEQIVQRFCNIVILLSCNVLTVCSAKILIVWNFVFVLNF
jgi:hypothetical protein